MATTAQGSSAVKATVAGPVSPFSDTTRWTLTSGGTLMTWIYRVNAFTLTTAQLTASSYLNESNAMANATTIWRIGKLVSPYGSGDYSWNTLNGNWWLPTTQGEMATTSTLYTGQQTPSGNVSYADGDYIVIEVHMDDATGVTMGNGYTLVNNLSNQASYFETTDTIPAYAPPGTAMPPHLTDYYRRNPLIRR
jgi:hypothetical protein